MKNSDILILNIKHLINPNDHYANANVNLDCFNSDTTNDIKKADMVLFQYLNGDITILKSRYNIVKS
jgi:hypothetical protein